MIQFIAFALEVRLSRTHVERCRRYEGLQYGARTFFESLESAETVLTDQRTAILIEDCDFTTANEKTPFALGAVIESRFVWRETAIVERANHKLMSQIPIMSPERCTLAFPKLHNKAQGQISDQ